MSRLRAQRRPTRRAPQAQIGESSWPTPTSGRSRAAGPDGPGWDSRPYLPWAISAVSRARRRVTTSGCADDWS